jgi:hypothetical protein
MCEIRFTCIGGSTADAGVNSSYDGSVPGAYYDGSIPSESTADATLADASACAADACKDQAIACSTGPARNLRCVPDPNAGIGSDPPGHCILTGDCPEPGADASAH